MVVPDTQSVAVRASCEGECSLDMRRLGGEAVREGTVVGERQEPRKGH